MDIRHEQRLIGSLNCQIVDSLGDKKPQLLAFLCHGFGAPGDDLVSIASELINFSPFVANNIRFVFPAAPVDLSAHGVPGARAWWMIDMEELNRCSMTGEFRDLENTIPEGMAEARDAFIEVVETLKSENNMSYKEIVLGGFSQGSMLCTETFLNLPETVAGACLWSSTLINQADWRQKIPQHKSIKIVQSHGQQDPILPYALAEKLQSIWNENKIENTFIPFQGQHQIPWESIEAYVRLLESCVAKTI